MADVLLTTIPGFSDLSAVPLAADKLALGVHLNRINLNAAFGLVRAEVFHGAYRHGDQVPLPTSVVDGYQYKRSELMYIWMVNNTANPDTGWATDGEPWTMWYGIWNVVQASGNVISEIGYRGNQDYPDRQDVSKDGWLTVFTIAQRQKGSMTMSAIPAFNKHLDTDFYTDRALNTSLMTDINANAKFACVNSEIIYMGEFTNGQTVPQPVSPVDGKVYAYADVKFIHSWRWTADTDGGGNPIKPSISKGQLDDWSASVSGVGVVAINTFYESYGRHSYTTGKIAVFAFCSRALGTTFAAQQNLFAEIADSVFYPGSTLRASTLKQLNWNSNQAVMSPEIFGPTNYNHGNTVPLPTSPIDGYVYTRAELSYAYDWANTGDGGDHGRMIVSQGYVGATGVLSINHYRLPAGASSNVLSHEGSLRVITIAKRRITHQPIGLTSINPPDWTTDAKGDDPTGPLFGNNLLPNPGFEEVSPVTGLTTDANHWTQDIATPLIVSAQRTATPAPPAILSINDTFTGGAADVKLHTPDIGRNWTKLAGANNLNLNGAGKLIMSANSATNHIYYCNPIPVRDGYTLQLDCVLGTSVAAADRIGFAFRIKDAANYYLLFVCGNGDIQFHKVVANVGTLLQTIASGSGASPTGTLKVIATGSNFAVYWNAVLKATWSDVTYSFLSGEWTGVIMNIAVGITGYSADNFSQTDAAPVQQFTGNAVMFNRIEPNQSIPAGTRYFVNNNSDTKIPIADAEALAIRMKLVLSRDIFSPHVDDFTGVAATLLSAYTNKSFNTWTRLEVGNDFKIDGTGTKLVLTVASTGKGSYAYNVKPSQPNHDVSCDLDISASAVNGDYQGIQTHMADASNFYFISIRGNQVMRIEKKVAGTITVIAADTAIASKTGTMKVMMSAAPGGVRIDTFWSGTLIHSIVDTSFGAWTSAKSVGIGGGSVAVVSWDNFTLVSGWSTTGLMYTTGLIITGNRLDGSQTIIARRLVQHSPFTIGQGRDIKYISCAGVIPQTGPGVSPWAYATVQFYTDVTNLLAAAVSTPNGHDLDVWYDDLFLIRVANVAGPELLQKGSIPPGYVGGFTFTSTTNSLQWSWALNYQRTDIDLTIETVSGSQLCTGLTTNTSYNHYPYLDENTSDPFFDMVKTGGIGLPSWSHIGTSRDWTQEQSRTDHAPLTIAPFAAATTASGSGGGGNPPPDGGCLLEDVLVEERKYGVVQLGTLAPGWYDLACDKEEDTPEGWVRTYIHPKRPHRDWVHTAFGDGDGGVLDWVHATEYHPWTLVDGSRRTSLQLTLVDSVKCRTGVTPVVGNTMECYDGFKVPVTCQSKSHTFWCGMKKPQINNHNMNPGT